MPIVTRKFCASTLQEVFARLSVGLPRLAPVSEGPFFLDALLSFGVGGSEDGAAFGVSFSRS